MSMNSFHSRQQRAGPRPEAKVRPVEEGMERKGVRADALLVQLGLAPSRQTARQLIEAGRVSGPEGRITKPAQLVKSKVLLQVSPIINAA